MKFFFKAATLSGRARNGTLEAPSRSAAITKLKKQKLTVINIRPDYQRSKIKLVFRKVSLLHKMLFAKNLATMIKSGVPLNEALGVVAEESNSPGFKNIIFDAKKKVESGQELSAALSDHIRALDPLFISLVRVGERSGNLEANLFYLSAELAKQLELKKKITSAMAYPSIVVATSLMLGFVLAYFVLPKIIPLFNALNVDLPLPTIILLSIANCIQKYGLHILVSILVIAGIFRILISLETVKPIWHRLIMNIPVAGSISRGLNISHFSRTLGLLLKSGIPLVEALEITRGSLTNYAYRSQVSHIIKGVSEGRSIFDKFGDKGLLKFFPLMAIGMVRVGERSGTLEDILTYLGEYYKGQVDDLTKNLSTILEPILLIVIGIAVAFIAAAIIMPIYKFSGSIRVR